MRTTLPRHLQHKEKDHGPKECAHASHTCGDQQPQLSKHGDLWRLGKVASVVTGDGIKLDQTSIQRICRISQVMTLRDTFGFQSTATCGKLSATVTECPSWQCARSGRCEPAWWRGRCWQIGPDCQSRSSERFHWCRPETKSSSISHFEIFWIMLNPLGPNWKTVPFFYQLTVQTGHFLLRNAGSTMSSKPWISTKAASKMFMYWVPSIGSISHSFFKTTSLAKTSKT